MEEGGTIPDVKVSNEAFDNIKSLIGFIKLESSIITGVQGKIEIEYCYNLCYHENFKENLFVVCQVRTFDNSSLKSNKFKVYAFDLDGFEVPFEQDSSCNEGFFENCYILKEDFA